MDRFLDEMGRTAGHRDCRVSRDSDCKILQLCNRGKECGRLSSLMMKATAQSQLGPRPRPLDRYNTAETGFPWRTSQRDNDEFIYIDGLALA
jgi:hypothetical protein